MTLESRRYKSYADSLNALNKDNCSPLYSFDNWKGLTSSNGKSTVSNYYNVKCNKCGIQYKAYFKKRGELEVMKCPVCSTGHKNKDLSLISAKRELKDLGYELLDKEWKGKTHVYTLKCLKCGVEFKSSLRENHVNNCPFCKESKNQDNQMGKLLKVCELNGVEPLFDSYEKQFLGIKRARFLVKCKRCGCEYETTFIGHEIVQCPSCTERGFRSKREIEICDYLDRAGVGYFKSYRNHQLKFEGSNSNFEFDIFIPSKNIAFEFNGYAYHNSGSGIYGKSKRYHQNKTQISLDNGIRLYHIWESTSLGLCKSIISSKLGLNRKIYARNCLISEISNSDSKKFFNKCHVDGYVQSSRIYALFSLDVEDEISIEVEGINYGIVCAISIMNRAIQSSKESVWEIGRFASKRGITVVGGYSRLLKHSICYLKSIGESQLVSYCNRDLSPDPNETFYAKYGFEFLGDSGPIYKYWASKNIVYYGEEYKVGTLIQRHKLQKQLLVSFYKRNNLTLPEPCTEYALATEIGFMPVYNSGNFKYKLKF